MAILSREVQKFIREIQELGELGCLLVPRAQLETLITALDQSSVIIGKTALPGRVTYQLLNPQGPFQLPPRPGILVVTEEDYSSDSNWAERIRGEAAYFLAVSD